MMKLRESACTHFMPLRNCSLTHGPPATWCSQSHKTRLFGDPSACVPSCSQLTELNNTATNMVRPAFLSGEKVKCYGHRRRPPYNRGSNCFPISFGPDLTSLFKLHQLGGIVLKGNWCLCHEPRQWIGIRDGEGGSTCPPKIGEKYFSGNYYVKFGHLSGKHRVKFGNFVNFSGKNHM